MTEWWVSQAKHFCKICRVWTGGHRNQILKHEGGRAHIENEANAIKDASKRAKERDKAEKDVLDQLAEIERKAAAAMVAQAVPPPPPQRTCQDPVARQQQAETAAFLEQVAQKRKIEDVVAAAKKRKTEQSGESTGWTKHVDPNSGVSYYYNSITKTSSWQKPDGFVEHAEGATAVVPDGPCANGSPWTACTDPNSGSKYFYNSVTKESRWEQPAEFVPSSNESGNASASMNSVPNQRNDVEAAPSVAPQQNVSFCQPCTATTTASAVVAPVSVTASGVADSQVAAPAQGDSSGPGLNGGSPWVVCTDPTSGHVYYFNKVTKASTWDMPSDLGVDLSKPPPPPAQKPPPPPDRSSSTVSSAPDVGGWQEVLPENSMWKPADPNEPMSEEEEQDPIIAMKHLTMQRGAWMDEDYERHAKEMVMKESSSVRSSGAVSFATKKKASGIRKRVEED